MASLPSATVGDADGVLPLPSAQPTSSPQTSPRDSFNSSRNQHKHLSVVQLGGAHVQWTTVLPAAAQPLHVGASLKSKKGHRSVNAPWKLFDHESPSRHATASALSPSSSSSKSQVKSLMGSKILSHSPSRSAHAAGGQQPDIAPVTLR
jgi:hypothetical protein